jgi:hypothetical protein
MNTPSKAVGEEPFNEGWSRELKNWYSFGAFVHHLIVFFSSGSIWFVLHYYVFIPHHVLTGEIWLWPICFVTCLLWATVGAPEPSGFPSAGKDKLTKREILYSFTNSFFLFVEVLGVEYLIRTVPTAA